MSPSLSKYRSSPETSRLEKQFAPLPFLFYFSPQIYLYILMKSQHIFSSTACRTLPVRLSPANEKPAFADSRPSTQRQAQLVRNIIQYPAPATSQMKKVIQRASPDEWFDGIFRTPGPKTITVYSHILSDGYGDAGQLGNATRELSHLKDAGIVQNVVPYATYDTPKNGTIEADWRNSIIAICPGLTDRNLESTSRLNHKSTAPPILRDWGLYRGNRTNWELQFPVPGNSFSPAKRLLRIFEMGLSQAALTRHNTLKSNHLEPLYHTGVANIGTQDQAVGYVIPSYKGIDKFKSWQKLQQHLSLQFSSIGEWRTYLNKAWFVKLNQLNNANFIVNQANREKCEKLILQGNGLTAQSITAAHDMPIHIISGRISQSCLDCLMACIGPEGVIYAGGEGMLVQALGVSDAHVKTLPPPSYEYQTDQYYADGINTPSNPNIVFRQNSFFARYMFPRLPVLPPALPTTDDIPLNRRMRRLSDSSIKGIRPITVIPKTPHSQ